VITDDTAAQVVYLPSDANDNVFGTAVCTYKNTGLLPGVFAISDVNTLLKWEILRISMMALDSLLKLAHQLAHAPPSVPGRKNPI
jgi:hypothetical protein